MIAWFERLNQKNEPKANIDLAKRKSVERASEEALWGPLGKDAYAPYAQQQVEEAYGNSGDPKAIQERAEMFKNYSELVEVLRNDASEDVIGCIRNHLKTKFPYANKQLTETPPGELGIHLKEIEIFSDRFVLKPDGTNRFPWMSPKQAWLFAHAIAPLHDLLKFLGTKSAQIMPDHEMLTGALVKNLFVGKKVSYGDRVETLDANDVAFIACVVEDHENIDKKGGRDVFISSPSVRDKSKAIFFIADVMTGVLAPTEIDGEFSIKPDQLRSRFTNLYFRHIDLDEGKVFSPDWGVNALGDIVTTLDALAKEGTVTIRESNYHEIFFAAAAEAIEQAERANETNKKKFTDEQLAQIEKTKQLLAGKREAKT
jgi:hypothetical protein